MTPTVSAQVEDLRGEIAGEGRLPLPVPSSLVVIAGELLAIWQRLDDAGREDLLAVAPGLAARTVAAPGNSD